MNTRYLLSTGSTSTSTSSSSHHASSSSSSSTTKEGTTLNFRRGFYRFVDTMIDERTLIGSPRFLGGSGIGGGFHGGSYYDAITELNHHHYNWDIHDIMAHHHHHHQMSTTTWGDSAATNNDSINNGITTTTASLQPLGYSILVEFVSQIRTKLTPAQMLRVVRIFSRVLHCDVPHITIHQGNDNNVEHEEEEPTIQLLPNFITPYSTLQIAAAKLLTSLPEIIFHNRDPNPQVGRDLLYRILSTFVHKLDMIKGYIPVVLDLIEKEMKERVDRYHRRHRQKQQEVVGEEELPYYDDPFADPTTEGQSSSSTSILTIALNLQHLLRPLIHGLKALFWCLSSYSYQRQKERQRSLVAGEEQFSYPATATSDCMGGGEESINSGTMKITIGERELMERIFTLGLPCCRLFTINVHEVERLWLDMADGIVDIDNLPSSMKACKVGLSGDHNASNSTIRGTRTAIHRRHREILESFSVSFTSLETHNFRKIMSSHNIHLMICQMNEYEDSNIIHFFSHLLLTVGKAVSYEFASVLIGYLMERGVHELGQYEQPTKKIDITVARSANEARKSGDKSIYTHSTATSANLTKHSQNIGKIFNLVFMSVLKYPRNESILLPHMQKLLTECIQLAMTESPPGGEPVWPGPYLNIVRALFRTVTGGKFDL